MSLSAITKKAMKVIADEQAGARVVDPVPTAHSPAVINAMTLATQRDAAGKATSDARRVWQRAYRAEHAISWASPHGPPSVRPIPLEAREDWLVKNAAAKELCSAHNVARTAWRQLSYLAEKAESDALNSEIERLRSRTETEVLKDEVALLRAKVAKLEVALANEKASVAGLLAESLE